ncbi:Protein of uncharacterised function (DUF551) [Klebsiella pneumoniae]|nr:Protein of uncharacterised function (DUF551) [Klebsiella pneumoniae]VAO65431.1 Protein of uncharacterised function (DUF551) [Klebsiella pneumoniae]
MTSKFSIDNRELLQRISSGEAVVGIDFGNLIVRELAAFRLAAMDSSESVELPLDYLQGHKDGLEWAAKLAEANHPETGDWLYDDPIELAKAIRIGPDMPPAQPVADSEPDRNPVLAYADSYRDMAKQGVESVPIWSVITDLERNIAPLYRHAQPAPLVPEEKPIPNTLSMYAVDAVAAIAEVKGWNACRAAMLDAEPVTMANKLPDDFDFDRFNDVTWLECVASNPHMHSPTTSTIARVALELNKRIGAGNSPAQSDCCPAQNHVPPEQNCVAPAQSQGWIPVSERMPPSRHEVLVGRWWGEKPLWCCKWATYIPGHPDAQSSGWLIPGASWTPTHWMPLPAAPQEVKSE